MKKLTLALLAAFALAAAACPTDPPPPPPEPVKPIEPVKPVEVPVAKPAIPAYEPAGEFADLKKAAAAGIDENNAMIKAAETEGALDGAITALEEKKKK
ncbi:MAG: hypothetical protein Q8O67_22180 [Deltaproteobacteria bacterium]|nr:hypothetical protein [Deltaproteobacteria bacterium]